MFLAQRLVNVCSRARLINAPAVLKEARHSYAKKSVSKKLGLPEEPKEPMSAFINYYLQNRKQVAEANPQLQTKDIAKHLATKWSELDSDIRVKSMKDFKEAKRKYLKELQDYLESLPPEKRELFEQFKEKKKNRLALREKRAEQMKLGHPKVPSNAYTLYLTQEFSKAGQKFTKEEMREFVKSVSQRWNGLPAEEKAPFVKQYEDLKKNYEREMLDWEEKMVRLGREDLIRKTSRISKS